MKLNGLAAVRYLAAQGATPGEVRFLQRCVANGAALQLEIFEGPEGKRQMDRIIALDDERAAARPLVRNDFLRAL